MLDSTEGIFQKTLYTNRKCPACSESLALPQQPPPPIGSEEHLLFSCPHTPPIIMTPFIFNINRILRQLRKPEWKLIPPHHQLSIALGSTPPPEWKLKVSQVDRLNRNLLNHCALLALRLSEYAKTLHWKVNTRPYIVGVTDFPFNHSGASAFSTTLTLPS